MLDLKIIDKRLRALIITQSIPQETGNGASIRLGLTAQSISEIYDVTLCVVTQDKNNTINKTPSSILKLFKDIVYVYTPYIASFRNRESSFWQPRMHRRWPSTDIAGQLNSISNQEFDLVYVVRLCMIPVFECIVNIQCVKFKKSILDLDDIESRAAFRNLMNQKFKLGRLGLFLELIEVMKLREAEKKASDQFDLTLVCSNSDKFILGKRIPTDRLATLPNAARIPDNYLNSNFDSNNRIRILLVGSLDYLPNEAAARWAIEKLAPLLRNRFGERFSLCIVGRRPPEWLNNKNLPADIEVFGDAPELESHYKSSFAVIAPIHSGGGTRIKILEAFGYGRPVISTSLGAEGIEAIHGENILIAETDREFLDAISSLESSEKLYESIVKSAHDLCFENYSPAAFTKNLNKILTKLNE